MKIYEIGTGYTPIPAQMGAATEIVVEELTKAFLKQGVPVEIIDIAATDRAQTALPIREVKVPNCFSGTDVQLGIMHKLKRVVYSIALAGELKKILKKTDERVVLHFHNQYNLFFFLKLTSQKLRKHCLIAYTNHSGIWRLPWDEIEGIIRKRYFQEAECMRKADIVFLLNQQTKENVITHLNVPEEHLAVINNGVNTDVYRPLSEEDKEKAKEKWGLKGCRVILQVGSVYENKGQLRSAEYLLPLLKEKEDLVFAYAGGIVDKAYQQQIQQFAKENAVEKQVRYLGILSPGEELNALYNTALATILPSKYESFGLVVIESFAAGIPVMVDADGLIQLGTGSLTYNYEGIAATIERDILKEGKEYIQLCTIARENAASNYSWSKVAGEYLSDMSRKI